MKLPNTIAITILLVPLLLSGCADAWPGSMAAAGPGPRAAYAAALQSAATPATADRAAAASAAPGSVVRRYWMARAAYDAAPPRSVAANTPATIIAGIRQTVATVGGAAAPILGPATGGLYSGILAAILAALAAAGGITTTIERRRRKRAEARIPPIPYTPIMPPAPTPPHPTPPHLAK